MTHSITVGYENANARMQFEALVTYLKVCCARYPLKISIRRRR